LASGFFCLAIAAFVAVQSVHLDVGAFSSPGPGFFLFLSSGALGLLSIILITHKIIKRDERKRIGDLWKSLSWSNVIFTVIALFVYALILPITGFILAAFGLLIILIYLGGTRVRKRVVYALIAVIAAYIVFHFLLQIQFPKGVLGF